MEKITLQFHNNMEPDFKIKISDGYCTWEFPLYIGDKHSIQEVADVLFNHYNLPPENGKLIENETLYVPLTQISEN